MRDHNGDRGPVPTVLGLLDHGDAAWWRRRYDRFEACAARARPLGTRPVRRFARGTFRVRL